MRSLVRSVACALSFGVLAACGGASDSDEAPPGAAGSSSAGSAGSKAGGGQGQGASSGKGGSAGTSAKGGSAGASAKGGSDAGGSSAGGSDAAGASGSSAKGGSNAGAAGKGGGNAGASGSDGKSGMSGASGASAGANAGGSSSGQGGSGDAGKAGESGASGSSGSPNEPRVAFAAIGDGGKGNTEAKKIGDAVAAKCLKSGCDFVQLLGDNIYDDGADSVSDEQWKTKFETPYASVNLPFWVVLGNHDYGGNGAGYEEKKADVQVDYSKSSTKWKLPSRYYHHVEGPAELFALDTNAQMYGKDEDQRKDFPKWIADSKAPWKIALGHHPYLSNGKHGNAGNYDSIPDFIPIASGKGVKTFAEDVLCGEVDLYLTGHDHSRQWLKPTCQGTELVVSGAGSGTTDLPGKNPAYFQAKTVGFAYVEVTPTKLTITMIDGEGQEEYTRTITK